MLRPAQAQVADVAYWVNKELERRGQATQLACINTAVEESTLADRAGERMLAQALTLTLTLNHTPALTRLAAGPVGGLLARRLAKSLTTDC